MTAEFLTELELRHTEDGEAILLRPLRYRTDVFQCEAIEVPAGFSTDFASVPRLPFVFLLFGGRAQSEAVLHDYLYRIDAGATRSQADSVFLEAMQAEGKPWYVRYPMYLGVRANGWLTFHRRLINYGEKT